MIRRTLAGAMASLFFANAQAEENVPLKPGLGRETVEAYCSKCHSLDYPRQDAMFLNRQAWEAEVTKMIKVFGAPIEPADATVIIDYLATNFGGGG